MSKPRRKKHAAKRKHETAAILLGQLADALTACDKAGLKVRLHHGVVETRAGYVLMIKKQWAPRTRAYDPLVPVEGDCGED